MFFLKTPQDSHIYGMSAYSESTGLIVIDINLAYMYFPPQSD